MSNDENKSLQQNLPLSWEEDSQNNLEEQAPPKKLLLKRDEKADTSSFQKEFESEPVVKPQAPKPLLLKKAPEEVEDEREYRRVQDSLDTIYDREIPPASEEYEEEYNEEEWEEESELEEEFVESASELENETDSFGVTENFDEDDVDEEDEIEDEQDSLEEDTELDEDDQEEDESDEEEIEDEQDSVEEDEYASAFEDSGTFTLDESSDDEESSKSPLFEEDEIEENRIEISESSMNLESVQEDSEEDEEKNDLPEESVFALKADTYYEVQTEDKSDSEEEVAESTEPAEVIQDYEVQTLGSLLQEARLSCSFTIKDAAEATRIKSSYIIALENNDMEELPAKVYVLNYIRQLCREYNVPNEPIIAAFERQSQSNGNGADVKIMRVGDEDARKATKPNSKLNALVVGSSLLVIITLILIAWYMKWFNPVATPDTIEVEVNLEEMRPEVKLPAPELPIPSQ